MTALLALFLTLLVAQGSLVRSSSTIPVHGRNTTKPAYNPRPAPAYMVDNQHNYYKTAPDRGRQNGPVWAYSGSLDNYLANLQRGVVLRGGYSGSKDIRKTSFRSANRKRQSSDFWLSSLGPLGTQPHAGGGDYQLFRNVVEDFGADNSGDTDTAEALNAASASWNKDLVGDSRTRCGEKCGNTFSQGAIVFFPGGTYKICTPVIQYYYTQFVGDPNDMPIIKGCDEFQGIALIDVDPYIPGASGQQWYINQNQFFRQIRNFRFDLTKMPESTAENDQDLVPTGIHWQVSQATSLQNLVFDMPTTSTTTAVGIFTENGSGGFVSDLEFNGGNIGWRAGSQQYTARNLVFNECNTAVQMVWDWGWNWQRITVTGGSIAFNISGIGGDSGQGTGSVSIIDSTISGVEVGVLTNSLASSPNIVLDNTKFENVASPVKAEGGSTLLSGNSALWATGKRYNGEEGSTQTGAVTAPGRGDGLNDPNGLLYVRSRPQYEKRSVGSFLVATTDGGCKNDATGDQASCINTFLRRSVDGGKIAYFPAGVYAVGSTVHIPTNSIVQGSLWSQILGSGFYFSDMKSPKVMVQVGNKGDIGTMEITEMLFSVRGATAGAILMEWNVAAVSQGAAAMWDSHFRVGGALGTDLDLSTCPKFSNKAECIAASLLFRVTAQANGYFENVWAWVSDHDNDKSIHNQPDSSSTQITIFAARGMLIESKGPSWFYGGGSEHAVLYNYLISEAKSVFMGHIQTESPYYQPNPRPPAPFRPAASFPNDPDFSHCEVAAEVWDDRCNYAWGLQIVDSKDVMIHSAGLYSFFNEYYQDCIPTHNCQDRILEVRGSTGVVIYNLFTVATVNIASGIDNTNVPQNGNQRGFTTEISVWVPLPGGDNVDIVWVGTGVWNTPTVTCSSAPCMLILPTSSLSSKTTIHPSSYTTSFEYGGYSSTSIGGIATSVFVTSTTTVTISIPSIVTDGIAYSNVNVSTTGPTPLTVYPSIELPPIGVPLPDGSGGTTTRTVTLPPWPEVIYGPPESSSSVTGVDTSSKTYYSSLASEVAVTGPTVTTITFSATGTPTTVTCPPDTEITFATPSITITTDCPTPTTFALSFDCPTTKVVTFLASTTGLVAVDCSLVTLWSSSSSTSSSSTATTTTPLPVWATWPPGAIIPITTTVSSPEPTDGGSKQPCTLWFFFICISHDKIQIHGWWWSFPPGIYPPGPPPPINWPPGFTVEGSLPPWPEITIGRDGQPTYSSEPTSCQTKTASLCSATTSYLITSNTETVQTTATSVSSDCETITGCSVSNSATATQTRTIASCTPSSAARERRIWAAGANSTAAAEDSYRVLQKRADGCHADGGIVFPKNPLVVGDVPSYLVDVTHDTIQSTNGYTAYYWIKSMSEELFRNLGLDSDVETVYYYYPSNVLNPPPNNGPILTGLSQAGPAPALEGRGNLGNDVLPQTRPFSHNASRVDAPEAGRIMPWKRAATSALTSTTGLWNTALISLPPGVVWKSRESESKLDNNYQYFYDDTAGKGATVYVIGELGVWTGHPEFTTNGNIPRALAPQSMYGNTDSNNPIKAQHGSAVAALISGAQLGVAKLSSVVYSGHPAPEDENNEPRDWYLEDLLNAWDDMNTAPRTPQSSVINISWGSQFTYWSQAFLKRLYHILKTMDRAGVTIVVASGNWGDTPRPGLSSGLRTQVDCYPQLFADPDNSQKSIWRDVDDPDDPGYLPNLIVVGATNQYAQRALFSQQADYVTIYASGRDVNIPRSSTGDYTTVKGTSYAAPQVAALAAYFKQLPSQWQTQLNQANTNGPKAVKAMIYALQRGISTRTTGGSSVGPRVKIIWNGMNLKTNCLLEFPKGGDPSDRCPNLPDDITTYTPPSCNGAVNLVSRREPALEARANASTWLLEKRQDTADYCGLPGADGTTLSFTPGPTAGPTCAGGNTACGGTICAGYWCNPTPTGVPPGYHDPKDPNSAGYSAPTTTIGGGSSSTSTTTSTPGTPTTPLERGAINCFNEADFPGHADIQSGDQDEFSTSFSGLRTGMGNSDTLGPGEPAVTMRYRDSHGVNYDYSCSWVPGCITSVDRQSFGFPLGSPSQITAYLLVREDYTKCNNGGVGGSCQVGCLLYTFEGGRGDGDPCDTFDCRTCGSPFEAPECQSCCNRNTFTFTTAGNGGNASTNDGFTIIDNMNGPSRRKRVIQVF